MMRGSLKAPSSRRGAVLVIVLLAILLMVGIFFTVCRLALMQQRQAARQEWQTQAGWIARSAVDRGVQRLLQQGDYPGETWKIDINGRQQVPVAIRVLVLSAKAPWQKKVTAEVTLRPPQSRIGVRAIDSARVDLEPPESVPANPNQ